MNPSDEDCFALLTRLHIAARGMSPYNGLSVFGESNKEHAEVLVGIVKRWIEQLTGDHR